MTKGILAVLRRIAGIVAVTAFSLMALPLASAKAEDGVALAERVGEVFLRSMKHWRYDYGIMATTKAGVACIPWQTLDAKYLDEAIFKALGFSYSVANEEAAIRIATQGCEQMKAHYELGDCACEVVLIDDTVGATVPDDVAARLTE
jgi:hypothetical protein